jgi:hypothetical protein
MCYRRQGCTMTAEFLQVRRRRRGGAGEGGDAGACGLWCRGTRGRAEGGAGLLIMHKLTTSVLVSTQQTVCLLMLSAFK